VTPCAFPSLVYIPCMNNHSHTDTDMTNAAPATTAAKIDLFETLRPLIEVFVIEALTRNGSDRGRMAPHVLRAMVNNNLKSAAGVKIASSHAFTGVVSRMVNKGTLYRDCGAYVVNEKLATLIRDNELHTVIDNRNCTVVRCFNYSAVEKLMV
jgi:hypothetical protein